MIQAVAIIAILAVSTAAPLSPDGTFAGLQQMVQATPNVKYVTSCDVTATWYDAVLACKRQGLQLASVLNPAEEQALELTLAIFETFQRCPRSSPWLGLVQNRPNQYLWVNGIVGLSNGTALYSNWNQGHPQLSNNGDLCAQLDMYSNKWYTTKCVEMNTFVCEKRDPSAPEHVLKTNLKQELGMVDEIDQSTEITTKATETTKSPKTTKATATTKAPETTKGTTSTKAPETTKATTTTKAPETTKATTTTKAPETTKATTSTKAPETTKATTTTKAPETTKATTTTKPTTTRKATTTTEATTTTTVPTTKATTTTTVTTTKATTTTKTTATTTHKPETTTTANPCPSYGTGHWYHQNTNTNDSSCYYFSCSGTSYDFFSAQVICEFIGGNLVSIHDSEVINFIFQTSKSHCVNSGNVWIGLVNDDGQRDFKWSDDSKVDYTSWDSHNSRDGQYICAQQQTFDNRWNLSPCSSQKRFICRVPPSF